MAEVVRSGRLQLSDRITQVPVLWDKQERKIVSNESADIIRMFATEFGAFQKPGEAHDFAGSCRACRSPGLDCWACWAD